MPTRLIREGIISSDRVEQLDWPAEVFYRRLLNKVDDYGLYDARPSVLRASLYPLRLDRVREADIPRWLAMCEKAGLIVLYEADGKKFLIAVDTRWKVRSEPKYPLPPPELMKAIENSCKQLNRSRSRSRGTKSESETGAGRTAPPPEAVFKPPNLQEIKTAAGLTGFRGNPEKFLAHYTACGWKDAQGRQIVDWRAELTKWKIRDAEKGAENGGNRGSAGHKPGKYSHLG